jgi:hypothetical protein
MRSAAQQTGSEARQQGGSSAYIKPARLPGKQHAYAHELQAEPRQQRRLDTPPGTHQPSQQVGAHACQLWAGRDDEEGRG